MKKIINFISNKVSLFLMILILSFISILLYSQTDRLEKNMDFDLLNKVNHDKRSFISPIYRSYKTLKKLILEKGDKIAYKELCYAISDERLLPYSMIMANKYNYPIANFDIYYRTIRMYQDNNIEIDSTTLAFALSYLYKGVELNDPNSIMELGILYKEGKFLPKDTLKGDFLINKSFEIYKNSK